MTQKNSDAETLSAIGEGLYGDRWIPRLAQSLAAFHPCQRSVSASYISAIHAGRKPFPPWIRQALPDAIAYEINVRQEFQRQLKDKGFQSPSR